MLKHSSEFEPFLDLEQVGTFEAYCSRLENTVEWGGQLELRALCEILQVHLKILSADAPPVDMGQQFTISDVLN